MKKILIFAAILFTSLTSVQGQTVLNIGNTSYITINGHDYQRGYITMHWSIVSGDTVIMLARDNNTSQPFRYPAADTSFKDGDNGNAAFTSFAALNTWWRAHAFAIPDTIVTGGGAAITSATLVVNGNNSALDFNVTIPVGKTLISAFYETTNIDPNNSESFLAPMITTQTATNIDFIIWENSGGIYLPLQFGESATIQYSYY